jgi:rare lipoprotein A
MTQEPFASIQIGNDNFTSGKDLVGVNVTIGEGKKQNYCVLSIYDPNGYYADKYISASYATDGIDLPNEFYEKDEPATTNNVVVGVDSEGGTVSVGGVFTPEIRAFLDTVAWKEVAPGTELSLQGYYSISLENSKFLTVAETVTGFPEIGRRRYIGRYQTDLIGYNEARRKYPQITNYTPANQDLIAYYKLEVKRGVLPYIKSGDIREALHISAKEWAAIPRKDNPRGYYNQIKHGISLDGFVNYYNTRLAYYKGQSTVTPELSPQTPKADSGGKTTTTEITPKGVLAASTSVSFFNTETAIGLPRKTSNGEILDSKDFTASHKTLPFDSKVKVTWLTTGKSVIVRINDRPAVVESNALNMSISAARTLTNDANPLPSTLPSQIPDCKIDLVEEGKPGTVDKELAKKSASDSIAIAKNSSPITKVPEVSAAGTQITVELTLDRVGVVVFSFLHTGTRHDQISRTTEFTGQSIAWVLNRRIKNTRYTGVTLKGLATIIAKRYNLELSMDEEGEYIDSISQVGLTDWQLLERTASRQSYGLRTVGKVLQVYKKTVLGSSQGYTIAVGDNVLSLQVVDQAQTDAQGSSDKIQHHGGTINTTVDKDTGSLIKTGQDNKRDAGTDTKTYTTGVDIVSGSPFKNPRPDGLSVKEYQIEASLYTSQRDLENLTPDTPLFIEGSLPFISNKSWFVESVNHALNEGVMQTSLKCYVPVKPKAITQGGETTATPTADGEISQVGVGSVGVYTILDPKGRPVTSFETLREHWRGTGGYTDYRPSPSNTKTGRISFMRGRPQQLVYDFTIFKNGNRNAPVPSPIAGKITQVGGSNGIVKIVTGTTEVRLMHLSGIKVKVGDVVARGQIVGTQASVGPTSTGIHLHIEAPELVLRNYINSLVSGQFN